MKKLLLAIPLVILICFAFGCGQSENAADRFTEEELKVFSTKVFEMWNEGNLHLVDEIIAPEYNIYSDPHDPYESRTLDHETYKKRILEVRASTPDIEFTNEDIILKGNKLVNRWTMSGTNNRTGKRFSVTGMTIYQLEGGKLKGHWQNVDKLGLYQQLGFTLVPPSPQKQSEEHKTK
jgi:hypothetical protein